MKNTVAWFGKSSRRLAAAVLMLCFIFALGSQHLYAITSKDFNDVLNTWAFYDKTAKEPICATGRGDGVNVVGVASGSKIYMIGDSLTVNSQTEIQNAFTEAGFVITKINADSGRAILTDTSPPGSSGIAAAETDVNSIQQSDVVVVALGTNSGVEDLNVQIPALVSKIRTAKPGVPIYWVNLFYTKDGGPSARNTIITDQAAPSKSNYVIIDTVNAGIELGTDGTHPTANGEKQFADTIVAGLQTGATSAPTGVDESLNDIPEDGNPQHILTYPRISDEVAAANAIDDYIRAGWPSSPFVGLGKYFISGGKRSNVNPFLAVGHLRQENGFATAARGWHTLTPPTYNAFGATTSQQPYAIYHASDRDYKVLIWPSWEGSLDSTIANTREDFFAAIRRKYLNHGSMYESHDFATYISHYAPGSAAGNDEGSYVNLLYTTIDEVTRGLAFGPANGPATALCTSNLTGGANGGAVSIEGYSFPIAPQTQAVGGITIGQTTTTHHDRTPAFDLFSTDSATVYALYSGTPVTINTSLGGQQGCSSIQFKADDGFYYWYGHMKDVVVAENVHIAAGTVLGKVADARNYTSRCWGGGPHLHIDRGCSLPGPNGVMIPQRGGSDDCRDPAFIPFLSRLYESLPR